MTLFFPAGEESRPNRSNDDQRPDSCDAPEEPLRSLSVLEEKP